ncbi:MAG: helix-turn-helix domain-containing protein [Roseiflexus sp.]|jgi:purine catabolism regulator|nr:helix-turn-helix domain-containing protein [Roseiflexus sp.]MBO9366166.1 helix-turn-helix domain-containing protein [Roseiflexus sp.]MBO9381321.1 helix-turn-helix domain-containing protein [Roseiflexus sp.]MBO9387359.1 helix-turn-helix domain-containing protein [Roseiflexus sp.]
MPPVTVQDVLRLALPDGSEVVAGNAGLNHQVSWVTTPRATPPAFTNLRGGECVVVATSVLRALDERLTLANLIERLVQVPVAAIAVQGDIPDQARTTAESLRLPLIRLPDSCDIREVEREIQRLISDYDAQIERRAAQLGSVLTQRSLAGVGVNGLLETLVERTGRSLAYYSPAGEVRALRARGPARVALQTLQPRTTGSVSHLGQHIWVQQIGQMSPGDAAGRNFGYLALCGDTLDDWDRLAAQQGASALALELAKEQAVLAAEERLRGDFVQAVLVGAATDDKTLVQRGRELGYDLRQPHVAMLCGIVDGDDRTIARIADALSAALNALGVAAPMMRRIDDVLCYLPAVSRGRRFQEVADLLRQRLVNDVPDVLVAIGREAPTLTAWSRSLREAEQALLIGRELVGNGRVLDFSDLGVYRLLLLLRESPELWEFYRSTLATLVEYDRDQHGELLKTLEAFFEHNGNLARTADALHIHRNTLLYRLTRIKEISGRDPDVAEDRLALWLALKAHRVLKTITEPVG